MSATYSTDGKCWVKRGGTVIAQSYVGNDGYEVRILQGLPRMETLEAIEKHCPEFLKANNWPPTKYPYLFGRTYPHNN